MIHYALYERPDDLPAWCVLARFQIATGSVQRLPIVCLARSLEELRAPLREAGLVCLQAQPGDVKSLKETWL